ncbi:hypothetical protein [Gloeocapsopsis sp. IPPAS B-1203]|uniref:hypothetical protein n=1 Tax=Gloeocapsopsis sp. IPPAS B-1203 TaxID=2049454 RepID=UPI0025A0C303|nr:hypothetical protein [Gloeocapsopsis sp. IPPAS B-1203]
MAFLTQHLTFITLLSSTLRTRNSQLPHIKTAYKQSMWNVPHLDFGYPDTDEHSLEG